MPHRADSHSRRDSKAWSRHGKFINNPFVDYLNPRDFNANVETSDACDLVGPEGQVFIQPEDSPNGQPLLVIRNEAGGTTRVLQTSKKD